jgi:branched-subunit amino acid aminotransferase/4-amino-4-deoxychorismate lyase
LFRLAEHLKRLEQSLDIVGVQPGVGMGELSRAAGDLAANNHALLADGDELGMALLVTPGAYPAFDPEGCSRPLVCCHTYPLPFRLWADKYERGQSLVVTDVRQVPAACWPPQLKCRSRTHYYLADRKADLAEPGSRALLLDQAGCVSEASTANLVIYGKPSGLISPPLEDILPGISLGVLAELAAALHIPFTYRKLTVDEVASADEAMLTSTSPCLLPVVRMNGRPIGSGAPGDIFRRLLAAWSELVGVDIQTQAQRFARR